MSKTISLVSAGAPAALLQSAAAVLRRATGGAVRSAAASAPARPAVVVGPDTPPNVHTAVTEAPGAMATNTNTNANANALYAGAKTVLVRAVLPRGAPASVQLRDALDVFAAAGIAAEEEVKAAAASFRKSAEIAVKKAKAAGATRVTLVVKQATKYEHINELFKKVSAEVIEAEGITTDVQGTAAVTNQLLVHPESLSVVLLNDVPSTENIEMAFAGATGGVCRTYHTTQGETVSAGHSYKSVALAVAQELRALGMSAEAKKIEAAAEKNPKDIAASM